MISTLPGDTQWTAARRELREWLAAHKQTQSDLARLAGVNRSIINRFLEKEQPLSTDTAIKLYGVIKLNLNTAERQQWMAWLHLEELKATLDEPDPEAQNEPYAPFGPFPNLQAGYYWLNKAWLLLEKSGNIPISLPVLAKAEHAFGPRSSMAALAACEIIQQQINLGNLAQAEREIFRVEQAYQSIMDLQTRLELLGVKAMAACDRRDYLRALQVTDELKALDQRYGISSEYQHKHIAGLAQLGLAEQLEEGNSQRQHLLQLAEENFRAMCVNAEKSGIKMHIGFMHFRLAQVLREQRQYPEAQHHRHIAQQSLFGDPALGHLAVEEANLALLNGETDHVPAQVESVQDGWRRINYAAGLARAAAVETMSRLMDGHAEAALEPAIIAAVALPTGACYRGDRFIDLPWQVNRELRRTLDTRRYTALIGTVRTHICTYSDRCACLLHVVPDRSQDMLVLLSKLENSLRR
jgi:transcriptional regulator with XRE-family HTH domain